MSSNALCGTVPSNFSDNMPSLGALDLSNNLFTGGMPSWSQTVAYLTYDPGAAL